MKILLFEDARRPLIATASIFSYRFVCLRAARHHSCCPSSSPAVYLISLHTIHGSLLGCLARAFGGLKKQFHINCYARALERQRKRKQRKQKKKNKSNNLIIASHDKTIALLALFKICYVVPRRVGKLPSFALDSLNFDALLTFGVPPSQSRDLNRLDFLVVNFPLPPAYRDDSHTLWEVEIGQVYLRWGFGWGSHFRSQSHGKRTAPKVKDMAVQCSIHIDWTWANESLGGPVALGSLRANTGD